MKTCRNCKHNKPLSEFTKNKRRADGYHSICKVCKNSWYSANRARQLAHVAANKRRYRQLAQNIVWGFLVEGACVDCSERDPVVLEFDHVSGQKEHDIGRMLASGSFSEKRLRAELAKCEIRCANCHRRRTALVQNSWRYQRLHGHVAQGNSQ